MEITVNRLKHSLAVATKMKELIKNKPNQYILDIEDAFILGIVHDIGYEFANEQREHAHIGGLFLKQQQYKYWQEVYYKI